MKNAALILSTILLLAASARVNGQEHQTNSIGMELLVSFDNKMKLGLGGTFAALSYDDGKTWPHVRKVPGPGGYMAVAQAPNGVIYHLGPSGGAPIRCVAYNEAWLKEGKPVE